jgi:hypothetical protein
MIISLQKLINLKIVKNILYWILWVNEGELANPFILSIKPNFIVGIWLKHERKLGIECDAFSRTMDTESEQSRNKIGTM